MTGKRSWLVTIVAVIFICWGALAILGAVVNRVWDPNSHFWYPSDHMWQVEFVGGEPSPELKRANEARGDAQMRYEVPLHVALLAWSLIAFVAALGLLLRKNWARVLFIGLMAFGVVGLIWIVAFFSSLRMTRTSDFVSSAAVVLAFLWIGWKLRSPPIVSEFRSG